MQGICTALYRKLAAIDQGREIYVTQKIISQIAKIAMLINVATITTRSLPRSVSNDDMVPSMRYVVADKIPT